jgi:2-phospho-L-lactate guanylyltransferase
MLFTIIPVKPFNEAKTRLSPVLSPNQRIVLSQQLLHHTIRVARQVSEVVVITRSIRVRHLAKLAGAWTLVETGNSLNEAIEQAIAWVMAQGKHAVLILPSDLPHLQLSALQEIIKAGESFPSIVLSSCHRNEGTNALFLRPPNLINVAFGPDSFAKHQQFAQSVGIQPVVYYSPTIAFDLDVPKDLKTWDNSQF